MGGGSKSKRSSLKQGQPNGVGSASVVAVAGSVASLSTTQSLEMIEEDRELSEDFLKQPHTPSKPKSVKFQDDDDEEAGDLERGRDSRRISSCSRASRASHRSAVSVASSVPMSVRSGWDRKLGSVAVHSVGVPEGTFSKFHSCEGEDQSMISYVMIRYVVLCIWLILSGLACAAIGGAMVDGTDFPRAIELCSKTVGAICLAVLISIAIGLILLEIGHFYHLGENCESNEPKVSLLVMFLILVGGICSASLASHVPVKYFGIALGVTASVHMIGFGAAIFFGCSSFENPDDRMFESASIIARERKLSQRIGHWLISEASSVVAAYFILIVLVNRDFDLYRPIDAEAAENLRFVALVFGAFQSPLLIPILPLLYPQAFAQ